MSHFILWFLIMMLVGWCAFPLTFRLFPAFIDRGYSLARILGLLIWGYLFWVLACLGIVQNDAGGLLLALIILAGLSAFQMRSEAKRRTIFEWIRSNWRTILFMDCLFLAAFAGMAFIRAGNPEILGTEKPMELAFINAILNSSTFPPPDPWLSGFGISYYYFGYVMAAMLAKASGSLGSVAFNLMLALVVSFLALDWGPTRP